MIEIIALIVLAMHIGKVADRKGQITFIRAIRKIRGCILSTADFTDRSD